MGRRKLEQGEALLFDVKTRINAAHHGRLQAWLASSRYKTMSELLRAIVCDGAITLHTVDASMDLAMEQIVRVQKELAAIGHNINQTTRYLHSGGTAAQQVQRLEDVAAAYRLVGDKVEQLQVLITEMSRQWLQK